MGEYKGIDVSRWNGDIDWKRVRASGIEFAMIKAASGSRSGVVNKDVKFDSNIRGALDSGIKVGIYLYSYSYSVSASKKEAENLVKLLEPYKGRLTYPVAYDIEEAGQKALGKATLTAMASAFCDVIRTNGYTPAVYASKDWWTNYLDATKIRADVWLAQWSSRATWPGKYTIWQYTSSGRVDGIPGNVDLNISYIDYGKENAPMDNQPSAWAKEAVEWAVQAGLLKGDERGDLQLRGALTREQLCVILKRYDAFRGSQNA